MTQINERFVSAELPPAESQVTNMYLKTDLADAYAIRLPGNAITDPELLARFVFSHQAPWIAGLMKIRDVTMAQFGVKTTGEIEGKLVSSGARRIQFFRIYETRACEIILGEDDRHLNFRLSMLVQNRLVPGGSASYLVMSTVVQCHNRLGRVYLALITPFHRIIAQSSLRRAAKIGWPILAS